MPSEYGWLLTAGCGTLQGQDTDKAAVDEIRKAVKAKEETTVRLLNYTKEGKPFWNMLSVAPINDAEGILRFYIGVQVESRLHMGPVLDDWQRELESAARAWSSSYSSHAGTFSAWRPSTTQRASCASTSACRSA